MSINRLAFLTILLTYILIVFGGYVATSESGMGCGPDWPLCNGLVIPVLQGATLIEFTHRVIGAILALVTLFLFFKVIKAQVDTSAKKVSVWMVILLIVQVLLGAFVVVLDLPAMVVTIHLLIAMVYLSTLIWLWRYPERNLSAYLMSTNRKSRHPISTYFNIGIVLMFATIGFGAYIKHQQYGLACDWLDCREGLLPLTHAQILQTVHRALAVVSAAYILLLTYYSYLKSWGEPICKRLLLATIAIIIQLAVGIVTILTGIGMKWAVLHLGIGTLLLAIIVEARIIIGFTISNNKFTNKSIPNKSYHMD